MNWSRRITPANCTSSLTRPRSPTRRPYVGIVQSLIVTCRLHGVDPYDYLVDVLQRVGQHPAPDVAQLTPRLWKDRFAANPLRSDVHGGHKQGITPVS
jgi:hypothetical protein